MRPQSVMNESSHQSPIQVPVHVTHYTTNMLPSYTHFHARSCYRTLKKNCRKGKVHTRAMVGPKDLWPYSIFVLRPYYVCIPVSL